MPKGQWYKKWEYAMYRGEDCVAIGTAEEICKQENIKLNTFRIYRTRTNQEKYNIRIIRLEEDEVE